VLHDSQVACDEQPIVGLEGGLHRPDGAVAIVGPNPRKARDRAPVTLHCVENALGASKV
jgi:hypothetical protein